MLDSPFVRVKHMPHRQIPIQPVAGVPLRGAGIRVDVEIGHVVVEPTLYVGVFGDSANLLTGMEQIAVWRVKTILLSGAFSQ